MFLAQFLQARDIKRYACYYNFIYCGLKGLEFLSNIKNIISKAFLKLHFWGFYIKKVDLVDLAFL